MNTPIIPLPKPKDAPVRYHTAIYQTLTTPRTQAGYEILYPLPTF